MTKITRTDIIEQIYANSSVQKKDIKTVLDLLEDSMKNAFAEGKNIEWRGLGCFEVRKRKGCDNARNPKTGEKLSVGERNTVFFRPGAELKSLLGKN